MKVLSTKTIINKGNNAVQAGGARNLFDAKNIANNMPHDEILMFYNNNLSLLTLTIAPFNLFIE